MASEKIGKVFKGEGPSVLDNGIVLPFDYKCGVFSSEVHQLALTNQELDYLAIQSITSTRSVDNIMLNMPMLGMVFVRATHVISDEGKIDMVAQLSSVTENPYTGIIFNTEGRFEGEWKLRDAVEVPDITLMTLNTDQMVSGILDRQLEQRRRDIKEKKEGLLERTGFSEPFGI